MIGVDLAIRRGRARDCAPRPEPRLTATEVAEAAQTHAWLSPDGEGLEVS
jgi:hypothetical protein